MKSGIHTGSRKERVEKLPDRAIHRFRDLVPGKGYKKVSVRDDHVDVRGKLIGVVRNRGSTKTYEIAVLEDPEHEYNKGLRSFHLADAGLKAYEGNKWHLENYVVRESEYDGVVNLTEEEVVRKYSSTRPQTSKSNLEVILV